MRVPSLFAGVALVFTLAACGQPDPLEYSRASLELQQQQQAAQMAAARAEALEPVSRFASVAWYVALGVLPILVIGIGIDAYLQRRRPMVRPDHLGQLPAPRAMIDSGELAGAMVAALQQYHQTQALAASQPRIEKLNITVKEPSIPQLPTNGIAQIAAEDVPTLPALPEIVELSDMLPTIKQGYLAFGVLPSGELLQLPFARAYHMLGAGQTRTGKTVLLDSMITQLHHMSTRLPLSLYGGDYKRELAATWHRSPLFTTIETEPAAIADMLLELVNGSNGVHARYDRFKALGAQHNRIVRNIVDASKVTGEKPHISVVVLDEINAVLEAAKRSDKVSEALKVLLQTGAGAGVFVLGGAQYLSAQVFSRDGSQQFTSRALFGAYDRTAAGMMFGSVDSSLQDYITGAPGRGLIRTVNQQHAVAFQALHCGEDDILDAIAVVSADGKAQATYSVSPSTTQESAITSHAVVVPALPEGVQNTPEYNVSTPTVEVPEVEKIQMIALAQAGISRTKICQQLYGVSAGRAYERVKQTLNAAGL